MVSQYLPFIGFSIITLAALLYSIKKSSREKNTIFSCAYILFVFGG